jgi:putative glutamine amidotransferase
MDAGVSEMKHRFFLNRTFRERRFERMKKVVGVIPLYDEERNSYWMIPGYMKMLEAQGAVPMMLPLTTNRKLLDYFLETCAGFLLTGGQDVAPELYHTKRSEKCGETCKERDEMESYLLQKAAAKDKSVLGICRGIQFMNAVFGGTLYQDLPSEYESHVEHHMKPPYNRAVHTVTIKRGTLLHEILKKEELGVNSYHHQAIEKLAPSLETMAVSEDGLIEAVYMPEANYVVGVQWHPELSYETDEDSVKIIKSFVESM